MKHGDEQRRFERQTGIESTTQILDNLIEHYKHPRDAIRMIDRTIGGLLAHTDSPFYHGYRDYASILFPAGLEATAPGQDIILVLNSTGAAITHRGQKRLICVPSILKNPEKGVAQIIGVDLACRLFAERGQILIQLLKTEKDGYKWSSNLVANDRAQNTLENDNRYPAFFDKPLSRTTSSVKGDEITNSVTSKI